MSAGRWPKAIGLILAAGLLVAACGGSSGNGGGTKKYVVGISNTLTGNGYGLVSELTDDTLWPDPPLGNDRHIDEAEQLVGIRPQPTAVERRENIRLSAFPGVVNRRIGLVAVQVQHAATREVQSRKALAGGLMAGLALFAVLVAPWFTTVFHRVPGASDFMIYGQAVGHVLGTTIRNRRGSPFYFFGILGIGLLPWTWLLCWLWRRAHWRSLAAAQKDGWLVLSVWAVFPFCLFSLTRAKLPAYILPIFPALSVMAALVSLFTRPVKVAVRVGKVPP